ncbi:MAG TPA: hypothetical protein VHY91_06285 [Pirellulales bacterium]|jgi:hypothetical protein|nr:hypothetical protein [Pirellulales bacterium]
MSGKSLPNHERMFAVVTVLCAAFICAQYSYRLRANTTHEMIAAAYGALHGEPGGPEFQNRLIFPVLMTAGRAALPASVSDVNLWKGLRLLTALVGFASAFACMRAISGSWFRATIGCVLLGYGYLWTVCTHGHEHSSDFLDLAFIAVFVWLALRGRYGWLAAVTVLASFNRESAAFSGLIVIGLAMARHGLAPAAWKGFAIGGCNVALALITVTAARSLYRGPAIYQHVGLSDVIENWRCALMPYGPATILLAMLAPLTLIYYNFRGSFSTRQRGLLLGCLGCFLVTVVFGILFELRVLLPCYLILICVLVLDESSGDDQSWFARACGAAGKSGSRPGA